MKGNGMRQVNARHGKARLPNGDDMKGAMSMVKDMARSESVT